MSLRHGVTRLGEIVENNLSQKSEAYNGEMEREKNVFEDMCFAEG